MIRTFLAILLAFATSAHAITTTDIWTPPGGAATTVSGADKLLIKQGANSRTITRDLLLSGVKPDYRGAYSASVSYPVNAAVLYQGTSYICLSATLAGESPVSQPAKWQVLAQKGDVGATGPQGPAGSGGSGGGGDTTISSSTPTTFASGTVMGSTGTAVRAATLTDLTTMGAVPNTRTVAGKALSANVILAASDVGADASGAATTAVTTHESTYTHGNLPTTGQKAALAGSSGTPGAGNLYVTAADSRLTDARTPVVHNQAWSTITGTPTTLLGYGISDAAASTHLHDSRYPISHVVSAGEYVVAPVNLYVGTLDPGDIPATDLWIDTSGEVGGVSPTAITCTGTDKVSAYNATTGVFTCSGDQTGAGGSGITSLGGLIGSTQTFVNDTNVTMTSTGTTHTLGWTGTLADGRIASASTWNAKQAALVSSTNIKTVGGVSLLGAGDLGTLGASYGGTGLTDFSLSGTAHKVASVGFTNPASVKCVEVDANGNLQIAGSNAACGSGGAGLSTSLTAAHLYVGNVSGVATDVAVTGDVTLSNAGAMTVVAGTTSTAGKVQLTDSTASTSTTTAATPNSVKTVNDALALKAPLISPSLTTPTLGAATATSLGITGTAGSGYIDLVAQSSNPSAPPAGTARFHAGTFNGFTRFEQDNEAATNTVIGRDSVVIAKNTSGGTINKGELVYITGSTGNVPNIAKARADALSTLPVLGVVLDSVINNAFSQIMLGGIISGVDTSSYTAGQQIYASTTTAGAWTSTRPSGTSAAYTQHIGVVLNVGASGSVDINVAPAISNSETGTTAATFAGNAFTGTTFNGSTIPTSKTLVVTTDKVSVHAATSSSELAGVISDETGSGSLVFGTNPTINGGIYAQTTTTASSITIDTNTYSGATLTAAGATTATITNVVAGKYFDFKISSSGGGAITIATLTPTWVTGTPASITAGKASWFVCKGTGANTADCAAVKENF